MCCQCSADPLHIAPLLNSVFRQVIMSGCVAFAKLNGPTLVESELLPQIWEQVSVYLWHSESNQILSSVLPSDKSQVL